MELTRYNEAHCHKWAVLLEKRRRKMEQAIAAIHSGDFETAQMFVSEIFHGAESQNSKDTDPGMEGSLLYHIAMVAKMEAEPKFVLEELGLDEPDVTARQATFFDAFVSDVKELTEKLEIAVNSKPTLCKAALNEEEKISLFEKLAEKTQTVEAMLKRKDFNTGLELQRTFSARALKGKCGKCEYTEVCGGCRARAYGLTSDFIDFCGDLHEPTELHGDYLAEEPWCTYKPKGS